MIVERWDVVSIWMGTSKKSIKEFNEYTEGMEDFESNCPAFKDFGVRFINSDMFIAYGTPDNKVIPIEELVQETSANSKATIDEIIERAKKLGIFSGNSLYSYNHHEFIEDNPGMLYNDLRFIGTFDNSVKRKKNSAKSKI